jgi:hypothetical protein
MKETGGINFADFHGREMQGPACRKFLEKRDEILMGIQKYILVLPEAQKLERDDAVTLEMLNLHRRLLGHLDAFISFLKANRYTIDMEGEEYNSVEEHRAAFSELWWHLKIPRTPKYHLGKHALKMCKMNKGIGENAEDEGERGHQTGSQAEKRYGGMTDYVKKTNSMNNHECMAKDPRVKAKQDEMNSLTARNFLNRVESADDRRAQVRQVRVEKRAALLTDGFTMPMGEMVNLRDRKKLRMLARGTIE